LVKKSSVPGRSSAECKEMLKRKPAGPCFTPHISGADIMSTRINLHFIEAILSELSDDEEYLLTRLMGWVVFKTARGWSIPMDAIIDTGAHTSILPKSIWKVIRTKKTGSFDIQGISSKKECRVPCGVGQITAQFIDELGNTSKELKITAFLALTDEVPLIIGFKDILSEFKACFNQKKDIAFLEEI